MPKVIPTKMFERTRGVIHFDDFEVEPTDAEFYQEFKKYNENSRWITLIFLMTCVALFALEMDYSVLEIGTSCEESCLHIGVRVPSWYDNESMSILYPPLRMACLVYDYNVSLFKNMTYADAEKLVKKMKKPPLVHCSEPVSSGRFSWDAGFVGTCRGMFYRNRIGGWKILGRALGSVLLGVVADLYGRKSSLYIAVILYYLGLTLQTVVKNFFSVQLFTVIKGMGTGGFDHLLVLFLELCSKNNRAILMVYVTILVPFTPLMVLNMKKHMSYSPDLNRILAVPTLYLLFYLWFVPESPRWYLSFSRKKDAWNVLENLRSTRMHHHFLPNIKFKTFVLLKENLTYLFTISKFIRTIILGIALSTFLHTTEYSNKQFHTLRFLQPSSHQTLLCMARLFSFMYALPPLIILRRRLALVWFFLLISIQLFIKLFCDTTASYVLNLLMVLCIHCIKNIFILYMYEIFPTCVRASATGFIRFVTCMIYLPHFFYESFIYTISPTVPNAFLFISSIVGMVAIVYLPEIKLGELPDYKRYRQFYAK